MRRAFYFVLAPFTLLLFFGSALVGVWLDGSALHPMLRPLSAQLARTADRTFHEVGATRADFTVTAADGVTLRGWKVYPAHPSGSWVLLFHGMSDNRAGMLGQARLLLMHGYSLIMMDARAHGDSGGSIATYGWLERADSHSIVDALYATETPHALLALGSSMGAAIALQSAGVEPRIAGVVAESSFSDFREATYDYAGLHWSPWLGKTLFRPATWTGLYELQKEGGFSIAEVSPQKAVARRPFPILLICDSLDQVVPCRHSQQIFAAATGPKTLWEVPLSGHAAALGNAPAEYERRVISFFDSCLAKPPSP